MLEYSNILGGRLKSINFQGRTVEEGANWVTGTQIEKENGELGPENPVWTLAKEAGLECNELKDVIVFDSDNNGKNITKKFTT